MEQLPGMKQTEQSLQLFANQVAVNRSWSEFIDALEYTPMSAVIQHWLSNLSPATRRNYAYYIDDLRRRDLIPEYDGSGKVYTVGHFRHSSHELALEYIKKIQGWSEGTRQVRAACYISLTAYIERISRGWFRKAQASTLAANKTFFQINDKCVTQALTLTDWYRFIEKLDAINHRDGLIARCILQGAKRVSEVLEVMLEQIDWDKNIIHFQQKKSGGMIKKIPITYPQHFMDELRRYIAATTEQRKDAQYVFITRTGRPLTRERLHQSFARACAQAKIAKISPHVLRATWVTLAKQQGVQDTEIMKITGHTSSKMIYGYDKTSAEDNYSKKMILV